jgi:cytochrome c
MLESRVKAWILCFLVIGSVLSGGHPIAEVALDPISPHLSTADPAEGEKLFLQCRACHVAEKGSSPTIGPNLWGIVDRGVGSMPGFSYSESLKAIGGEWDYETLSRYLFDPKAMAPETRMAFPGIKSAQQRADLIAHLRILADDPVPLPKAAGEATVTAYGGLPKGEGREAVYFTCRACHALEQFTDRNLSHEQWDSLLKEMVATNGMAAPESWAQRLMLDYLAAYFGEEKDWQGLPSGPGREEVFYTCNACHSLMLVTQQGMSRARWDETLDWMVEEQGMNEIEDVAIRDLILDYLAKHFGSG